MVITQSSIIYQLQQVVVEVRGALTHQVQVDQVVVLDKLAVELMQAEQPALLDKVITADPMAASMLLTIQVVVEVALVLLVEMPQAAVLQVLVVLVRLGLMEPLMLEVVEAVITPTQVAEQAVVVAVAKVDTAPLKAA
jgi:hypothetical protein